MLGEGWSKGWSEATAAALTMRSSRISPNTITNHPSCTRSSPRVENTSGSKYYVEDVSNLRYNTNVAIPENYQSSPSSIPGPPYGSYRNQPIPYSQPPPPPTSQFPPYPPHNFQQQHYMHQYPPPPHNFQLLQQQNQLPLRGQPSTPTIHTKEDRDLGSILLGFMNTVRHNHPVPPSPPASAVVTSSDSSDTQSTSDSEVGHHLVKTEQATSTTISSIASNDQNNNNFTSSNVALHTATLDEEYKLKPLPPHQSSATSVSTEGGQGEGEGEGERTRTASSLIRDNSSIPAPSVATTAATSTTSSTTSEDVAKEGERAALVVTVVVGPE